MRRLSLNISNQFALAITNLMTCGERLGLTLIGLQEGMYSTLHDVDRSSTPRFAHSHLHESSIHILHAAEPSDIVSEPSKSTSKTGARACSPCSIRACEPTAAVTAESAPSRRSSGALGHRDVSSVECEQ